MPVLDLGCLVGIGTVPVGLAGYLREGEPEGLFVEDVGRNCPAAIATILVQSASNVAWQSRCTRAMTPAFRPECQHVPAGFRLLVGFGL